MSIIKEEIEDVREIITGFNCNKCDRTYGKDDIVEMQEALIWQMSAGYGSLWGDGNNVQVVLCQKCAVEVVGPYVKYV